jgi:TolB-like protein
MAADVSTDEAGTSSLLKATRSLVGYPIAERNGRVFGAPGDSIIAEFNNAAEATEAALAVQSRLAGTWILNDRIRRLRFRIGLHTGEVIVDDDNNLFGDGVTIAVRLKALADPCGICLSQSVYEQIRGKIDATIEPIGVCSLKNIVQPIKVYRFVLHGEPRPIRGRLSGTGRSWRRGVPLTIALCLCAGLVAWFAHSDPQPTAGQPSIAVLPLTTIDGDESTQRLAAGLSENIITDFSHFGGLEVVGSLTKPYQGRAIDLRTIGNGLGVSYVLTGSIQRQRNHIWISAELVESATGAQVWRHHWERLLDDVFAIQAEISEQVAARLGYTDSSVTSTSRRTRKILARQPVNLEAYDSYLLAVEALGKVGREAIESGILAATKSISLDPEFARAYAIRARLEQGTIHYGADFEQAMRNMEGDARKSVELAPNDPDAWAALAWFSFNRGQSRAAEAELREALAISPANISLMTMAAAVFSSSGHPGEGAALADKVLRLDPFASSSTLNAIENAYFFARRFEDVVIVASRVPPETQTIGGRLMLAASLAFLGRKEAAAQVRSALLAAQPGVSAELLYNQGWQFERVIEENLFLDAIQAVNLPKCATASDLSRFERPARLAGCPSS